MEPKLDIVLLGATGYTGKIAAKNLALICKEPEYKHIKWGIAGRSKEKMRNLLIELQLDIPMLECGDIIKKAKSKLVDSDLVEVTKCARVIMNTTGPNTLLSEAIVKACIATGTHYVDISAELYHMLNIYRGYNKAAEQANLLIVPACGFACIPVVAGLTKLQRNFNGILRSVECYTYIDIPFRAHFPFPGHNNSLINYGTWESLVFELTNYKKYSTLRKETFPEIKPVPEELNKSFFHRNEGRFWYPYPGPENDVIELSQHYQSNKGKSSYYFKIYTTMPHFIHFLIIVPVFFIYYFLCQFACFRKLLWRFPRTFTFGLVSHKGPTEKMKNDTKFNFTLNGQGWKDDTKKLEPDNKVTVKVSGCDPGYETTSMCIIFAAITILTERHKMPSGGVIPTGEAFNDTDIADKLVQHNVVQIENVSKKE